MIKGSIHQEDTNSVYTKKKKALIYEVKNTGEIRKYISKANFQNLVCILYTHKCLSFWKFRRVYSPGFWIIMGVSFRRYMHLFLSIDTQEVSTEECITLLEPAALWLVYITSTSILANIIMVVAIPMLTLLWKSSH